MVDKMADLDKFDGNQPEKQEWKKVEVFFRYNEKTQEYKSINILKSPDNNYFFEGKKGGESKRILLKLHKNEIARLCLFLMKTSFEI